MLIIMIKNPLCLCFMAKKVETICKFDQLFSLFLLFVPCLTLAFSIRCCAILKVMAARWQKISNSDPESELFIVSHAHVGH